MVVVLPAPFGPSSAKNCPCSTSKLTPSTAFTVPFRYLLTRSRTSIAGAIRNSAYVVGWAPIDALAQKATQVRIEIARLLHVADMTRAGDHGQSRMWHRGVNLFRDAKRTAPVSVSPEKKRWRFDASGEGHCIAVGQRLRH